MAGFAVSDLERPSQPIDTPPLVFVGPTVAANDVHQLFPGAELRPPIRRYDLHLARMLGYSVFVIIDGVFAQTDAISPREVVDVVQDGALVFGAASMGALRAVDCAPVGAIGSGSIYRLFRRGILEREDEVAVTFIPERPFPALTLAMAAVRLTLNRAVRQNRLSRKHAILLFQAGQHLHYQDRTWDAIFALAGCLTLNTGLRNWLDAQDPKAEDARHLLKQVARRIVADPDMVRRPRATRLPFADHDETRSRPTAAEPDPSIEQSKAGLLLWLIQSERLERYLKNPAEDVKDGLKRLSFELPNGWQQRLDQLTWDDLGCSDTNLAQRILATVIDQMNVSNESMAEFYRMRAAAERMRRTGNTNLSSKSGRKMGIGG